MWAVASRDAAGYPTELRRLRDAEMIRDDRTGVVTAIRADGAVYDPGDVITVTLPEEPWWPNPKAVEPPPCPHLAELDCYAALGDTASARLARWHADHPNGPLTPEEYAEEHAVRVGFERRRMN